MNFLRIWIISSLIAAGSLLAIAIYDGSAILVLYCAPREMLISASFLGLLVLLLRILRAKSPINWMIPYVAAIGISLYLLTDTNRDYFVRSDPENDFKRFVMGGPHWADEDGQQNYNLKDHRLPDSVRVIKSRTFENIDGEGAAVYFEIDKKDLGDLLASDGLTPSIDPRDLEELNKWAGWYLWVKINSLGASPSIYVRKEAGGIDTWLMAVNHDQNRALFLYLNVN